MQAGGDRSYPSVNHRPPLPLQSTSSRLWMSALLNILDLYWMALKSINKKRSGTKELKNVLLRARDLSFQPAGQKVSVNNRFCFYFVFCFYFLHRQMSAIEERLVFLFPRTRDFIYLTQCSKPQVDFILMPLPLHQEVLTLLSASCCMKSSWNYILCSLCNLDIRTKRDWTEGHDPYLHLRKSLITGLMNVLCVAAWTVDTLLLQSFCITSQTICFSFFVWAYLIFR